jgi:hypothetical protein
VTGTLPGADVRGFYQALGIDLPGWAQHEAPVRCFADPDAHARGDRDPSCSVNIETGAWHCWGCGAKGGAYDAALARGLDSRQASELKAAYSLGQRDSKRPPRVVVSRSLAALARGLPASWRRPLGRAWRSMSGSFGRRALGLCVCCGHRACCAASTGVCGRARRFGSWAVAGSAAAC